MKRNLFWKFLLVLFILGWSIWELYPPTSRNLIDEFNRRALGRDTHFTAIVEQARKLDAERPQATFANLREAVGTNDISRYFPSINLENQPDATRTILQRLQHDASGKIKLGLDLRGGTSFLVGLDTNQLSTVEGRQRALEQAVEVLRKRVDKFGVAEPLIQPAGEDLILIQLPGLTEAEKEAAKTTIQKAAFLEFRMVHPESDGLMRQGLGAPGYEVLKTVPRKTQQGQEVSYSYLVKKKSEKGLTGSYVSRAGVAPNPLSGQPEIILNFDPKGAELFADITTEHTGRLLAIVLDGELYSAPRINEPIKGGSAQITGDFTMGEAFALANVLENPLEAPVRIVNEYSVEPSLGKDSIKSGVLAAVIGTVAVAAFMVGYYLFSGMLAVIALSLNIVILIGVMCSVGTVLTLPGIAGIVLTIGMAVDANVLIFERMREELDAGKSIRGAVSAGYDKAFGTIFDTNLTTLIASVILIFMGTGPVKGFGVALTIGVAVSMFTALVVTRLVFDWLLATDRLKRLRMLRLIRPGKIDFLKFSKPAFICSWILVLIGTGYGISRGKEIMGVDFAGGDRLTFAFSKKVPLEDLRKALQPAGLADSLIQYQKDPSGVELLQVTSKFESGQKVKAAFDQAFPDAQLSVKETLAVGPSVGTQILKTAIVAVLLAMFGILVYVAMRYEFSFAVAAIVALVHDMFMTLGWFSLTGREFSAPMVAAVLTIIGFSINDTIVIFDRIREDLRLGVRGSFRDLINMALSQTLSRTIITSGTVFLATMSLYIFGGPVINDFAFTFLVGILTGTYSSVYIASALVLWWHKGERPKTSTQVTIDTAAPARI